MIASVPTAALLTATTIGVASVLTWGISRAARKVGLPTSIVPITGALMLAWLAGVAGLSHSGVLAKWTAFPPRWPLLPVTAIAVLLLLSVTSNFRRLAAEIPLWQPVLLQVFRVAVELVFWRLFIEGTAPVQITFEGRNFDLLIGLTAPLAAVGIARNWIGPRVLIGWNLLGLAMLANAVATVATSVPGPLHLNWPGNPLTAITTWPVIWIPAFLVPVAVFLHVVSIRQALSRGDAIDR